MRRGVIRGVASTFAGPGSERETISGGPSGSSKERSEGPDRCDGASAGRWRAPVPDARQWTMAKGLSGSLNTAVAMAMPSRKLPIRMFSLGLCWLLSGFTVGTATAGIPRVETKGDMGMEPPLVRIFTGSSPKRCT